MNKSSSDTGQDKVLVPLPVIEKMQNYFEHLYLREHEKWLKVSQIGEEVLKRGITLKNDIPHYTLSLKEYKLLSKFLEEITENII